MIDNLNAEQNEKDFLIQVLNRNGVFRTLDTNGVPTLKIDKNKLPSIKLVRSYINGRLNPACFDNPTARLFFYGLKPEIAQSRFDFNLNDFFVAYQSAKYSKNSAFDFLQSENNKENSVLRAIFDLYGLNESLAGKLSTPRRKPLKRLKIGVKEGKARKILDCPAAHSPKQPNLSLLPPNPSVFLSLDSIVKSARLSHDLNLFDSFSSTYFAASNSSKSKKNIEKLWAIFLKSVDKNSLSF